MFSVANKRGNVIVFTVQVCFQLLKRRHVEEGNSSSCVSSPEDWLLNHADGIVGNVEMFNRVQSQVV